MEALLGTLAYMRWDRELETNAIVELLDIIGQRQPIKSICPISDAPFLSPGRQSPIYRATL